MRTIKFETVLHAVARKIGWDPDSENFLTGAALSVATYVNAFIRKEWDIQDWPEWTKIGQFAPDPTSHIVLYTDTSGVNPSNVGRVFKVYLNNPGITPGPLETPFRLTETGVHCGFEHGTNVWIKYMEPPPQFTSEPWEVDRTYKKNELTYSPVTGESYLSLVNSNRGNDPAGPRSRTPPPVPTEVTQAFVEAKDAVTGTSEQWRIQVDVNTWYNLAGTVYTLKFYDTDGVLHTASYTTPGAGGTIADVLNGLDAAVAGGDAFEVSLTRAIELPNKIKFTLASAAFSVIGTVQLAGAESVVSLGHEHLLTYKAAQAAVAATPQTTTVFPMIVAEGLPLLYTVNVIDGAGVSHDVTYQSPADQSLSEIIQGIGTAIAAAVVTDPFWGGVVINYDFPNNKFELATGQMVNVEVTAEIITAPIWKLIEFPQALADAVMRGAYSDTLREEGQTDKAAAEEQAVAADTGIATQKFTDSSYTPLTDQVKPKSRYKVEA